MIYNLAQYLIEQLPGITFVTNGWSQDSPEESVMISETGGDPNHWYDRIDWAVQVMSRARTVVTSKNLIESVYELLRNKFGTEFPSVTVDGETFPRMKTYQISPLQTPGYLGATDEHLEMFSFNVQITTT